MSSRQKSKANTEIPLLPKTLEITAKYKGDSLCLKKGIVLPGRSNQKINEYLKEIAVLSDIQRKYWGIIQLSKKLTNMRLLNRYLSPLK